MNSKPGSRKGAFAFLTSLAIVFAPTALASDPYASLQAQDGRLAIIAEGLLAANAPLCRDRMALTGLVLHSRDQYPSDAASSIFPRDADVTVEAVVPESAGDEAGVLPGDAVIAIDGQGVDGWPRDEGTPKRDGAYEIFSNAASSASLSFVLDREGKKLTLDLPVRPGCEALVEILSEDDLEARADGRVIQVSYGLALRANNGELAVVLAHELSHDILEHRRRLEAASVSKGLFAEFGKNGRLNRQAEVEADRLSVHLLANAGYDPEIAPAFWRSELGRKIGGGLFRSRIYPSPEGRAEIMESEIAEHLRSSSLPSLADHLLSRRDEEMR